LKEASALTAKIPYISFVAGLLLQALTMRDEVKQYKEEWELVMEKVEQVAGLVTNIGVLCNKYKLKEKDIPPGLRTIFGCLEIELDGIGRALAQNRRVGGIKKMLLRKELLRKVKQYDGRLSTVLQTFQAALAVDSRFAQLAEGIKVTHGSSSGTSACTGIVMDVRSPHTDRKNSEFFFLEVTTLYIDA